MVPVAQKTIGSTAGLIEQSPSSAPRMALAIPLLLEQTKVEEKKPEEKNEKKK